MKKISFIIVLVVVNWQTVFAQQEEKRWFDVLNKVNVSFMQNEKKAQKTLDSLHPFLLKKANDTLLGLYFRIQSNMYSNQLDKVRAIESINKSISFYTKANNKRGIVLSTMNKGNFFLLKGDSKVAMQLYINALSLAQKNQLVTETASLYKNIGVLFYNQGKTAEALKFYNKSVAIFKKLNKKKELGAAYTNVGNCYYDIYDSKNAISNYNKAIVLAEETKDTINLAKIYNNVGSVYIDNEKDTIKGLSFLLKSLDLKEKTNQQNELMFEYSNIATLYVGLRKYDLAEDFLKKCYEMAIKSQSKIELSEVYENYSLLYSAKNDYKKAYHYRVLFSKIKDTLLNIENLKAVEELKTKYQTAEKEKQLLQKEIEIKNSRNRLIAVSSIALFIGLIGFLIYRQQKLKNKQQEQEFQLKSAISQIETQNQLQEQRLSISRDLHDNIGAQLTFVISSIDNLKFGNKITDSKITNQLTKISDFTKSTIIELRDTIWAMNSNEFTFEDLRSRIFNFIEKAKSAKEDINFKFTIDDVLKNEKFSSLVGINIYRTIQEALNNAVKYSEATDINVEVKSVIDNIQIEIKDNGKGFDMETVDFGNGLFNMKKRIEEVKGTFKLQSKINQGTIISISLKK